MKCLLKVLTVFCFFSAANISAAEKTVSLDDLLKKLEQGQYQQSQENKRREQQFISQRTQQDRLLKQAIVDRDNEIKRSERLETGFEENEFKIGGLNEALNKRLGSLKELFGVLQQVAGDTNSKFTTSVVSAEYPGRGEFLTNLAEKMGSSSELASIEEIERVWFELQREMTESGKVSRFEQKVTLADGQKVNKPVIRVGSFNLISDGKYLEWIGETESMAELIRQPSERFLSTVSELENSSAGVTGFALDPTGGSILGLLVQAPNNQERIEQGGTVGYVILALGLIALLIAAERYLVLFITERKVKRQLKNEQLSNDNPLGRVLQVKEKYANVASDTLELKLSEAILKEMPKLTRSITFIKIISVVAPLLGLLGTVTGMINTFQAITLFGTGDPKLMAGGISQALVTTVLGLVVAIPTVMLFTWLNTRSKNIVHILQEQSAGIIAERAEQGS
ncbi:MotA/TolQ/ExbB proton channel family protein [Aliikangiella coralliicola]|uniref:MotA/TolQ/ExbB proton channel family protein n=2 Tax=Aliikangiella coralliicola TaxID=2592383 RepID=A0A545UGT8_9GAMM|nr:MotA/TolQ/ExbB proton channel family protein [Aliikangiella coralliicola]